LKIGANTRLSAEREKQRLPRWVGSTKTKESFMNNGSRDVERVYSKGEVVAKLRRLADALESGTPFRIQIAGERIRVPARAEFSIEHERSAEEEEIEFQLKWELGDAGELTEEDEPEV
jgi:amphi-Trp domain-containing protein